MERTKKDYHVFTMRLPKPLHSKLKKTADERGLPLAALLITHIENGMRAFELFDKYMDTAVERVAQENTESLLDLMGRLHPRKDDIRRRLKDEGLDIKLEEEAEKS